MDGKIPSQNLVRQVNIESPVRQPGFYKPLVFDAIVISSALGLGYSYFRYLTGTYEVSFLLLAAGVFSALFTLNIFFTKSLGRIFLTAVLEAAAIVSVFYFYAAYDLKILAIAAGSFVVISFWGGILGRLELDNNLEIRFFATARQILKKMTTALVLAVVIIYLPKLSDNGRLFISKENFQAFFDRIASLSGTFYPGTDFSSTVGNLSEGIAKLELRNNSDFKNLSPANQSQILQQTAGQVMESVGQKLGVAVSPNDSVSGAFYAAIVKFLGEWRDKFGNWFLAVWALTAFVILRSLGTIFYWIIEFLSFLLYEIFLSSGFVHILGETRTHEVIEF